MIIRRMFNLPEWDWRPFEELERMRRLMEETQSTAGVFPLVNVSEDQDHIYVRAELPGVKTENIDLTATGESLAIAGSRQIESEGENVTYHRRERESGKFNRMLTLPGPIDPNRIEARFNDGVLTVTLPKAEESKPKKILIS